MEWAKTFTGGVAGAAILLAGSAGAEPITIELNGRADVILDGTSYPDVGYTIVLESDTDLRGMEGIGLYYVDGPATFTIDGVASGSIIGQRTVFVHQGVDAAGLTNPGVVADLLDLRSVEFRMWDLLRSIGPIFDPAPFATRQFRDVETTVGLLTLDALDVTFTAIVARSCYPDCDGSGALDFFDFLCFQNAFAAGDPAADCDGSGSLDFFDFLCFRNEFGAGCP